MDFSQVKKWKIPYNGNMVEVKQVATNGTVIWKGTWKFTINLGNYVSSVKYTTNGGSSWTSITSDTTLELDSGVTLRVVAETYSSEPATYQYTYTMTDHNFDTSWTETSDNGSVVVYRTATAVDRYYTITWKNWNGTVLETDTSVIHDATPSYDSATPTRPTDAQYTYTFSGWSPSVHTVTGDAIYTAYFQENLREYTLTITTPYGSWTRADYGETSSTFTLTVGYGTTIEKVGQEQGYDRDGLYIRDTLGTFETVFYLNVPQDDEYYTYNYTGITFPSTVTGNATASANITRTGVPAWVNLGGSYGSWSGGDFTAPYGSSISVSNNVINVGGTTRTWTTNSDTSAWDYTFEGITQSPEGSTLTLDGVNFEAQVSRQGQPFTVSFTMGTGVADMYTSTNSTATSGNPSGTTYRYGQTVYLFAKASDGYYSTSTYIGGGTRYEAGAIYRVGSVSVDGNENFGTVSLTRNPYIQWTGSSQSATLDGSAMTSGTAYYVKYNSSHTVVATASSGYYISSSSGWTNSTTMTVNNGTSPTKVTRTSTITSNTSWSTSATAYYSITTSVNGIPYSGTIYYYATSSTETISLTTSNITKYYSEAIDYTLTAMSIEVKTSSAGDVTTYGKLANGQYPYGYNADDKVITGYSVEPSYVSTTATNLTGNWLGSGTAYHKVVFSFSGPSSNNHKLTITRTDSAAANVTRAGSSQTLYIGNSATGASIIHTTGTNRFVVSPYSNRTTNTLSTISGYTVSPTTFSTTDQGVTAITATISRVAPSKSTILLSNVNIYEGNPDDDPSYSDMDAKVTNNFGATVDIHLQAVTDNWNWVSSNANAYAHNLASGQNKTLSNQCGYYHDYGSTDKIILEVTYNGTTYNLEYIKGTDYTETWHPY